MTQGMVFTTKSDMLAEIRVERARLVQTVGRVRTEQMLRPNVQGDWSTKDILAHIVAREHFIVDWLQQVSQGQSPADIPADQEAVDRFNEDIYRDYRERPLKDVLQTFHDSFGNALKLIEDTPVSVLTDAERFHWKGEEPIWRLVAENTWWHYRTHRKAIEEWLMNKGISVRPATAEDLDFVRQFHYLDSIPLLLRAIEDEKVLIAIFQDKRIGFLHLEYLWSRVPYIALITIRPEYRRRGVGRTLLHHTESFLRQRGYTVLYSTSKTNETQPQAWHRHVGFEECGAVAGIHEGGVGEIFFRRELGAA